MRFCEEQGCHQPVFSTCKISRKGYCKQHSYLREDYDPRSITQKAMDKQKKEGNKREVKKIGTKLRGETNGRESELMQSRNNLINDLDIICSRYIRLIYSDNNLNTKCFTCTTSKHWTLMQNGHFCSRKNIGLRFDLKNQRPQCEYCNCHLHGNLEVYHEELNKEENGLADRLIEQSHLVEKPSNDELKQLLIDTRAKLNAIEKAKGIKK